ncbi:MAG: FAD:protein FMN transferase [Mangrovibacterium sp.]
MKNIIHVLLLAVVFLFASCQNKYIKSTFTVFSTISNITYESPNQENLQSGIDSVLNCINKSLSPFDKASIVSKINRNEHTAIDEDFRRVYLEAKRFSVLTSGAYDVTVGPLVNEWGFGFEKGSTKHSKARIDSIMQFVGFEKIALMKDTIVKKDPRVKLDFSSIAKGYAVDKVGEYLALKGCANYLVDIGGEVRAKGVNPSGKRWRVGISKPIEQNLDDHAVQEILNITDKSLATSGNYRNFYVQDGKRYAHTIDPRKGCPVQHSLLSATILANTCAESDAAATACMVMGLEKSIDFIDLLDGVEAYFIYHSDKQGYAVYYTDGFQQYLSD